MTNDGATILKLLEVEHPAAKVLVELADLQDQEVGDGTTTVVSVGGWWYACSTLPRFCHIPYTSGLVGTFMYILEVPSLHSHNLHSQPLFPTSSPNPCSQPECLKLKFCTRYHHPQVARYVWEVNWYYLTLCAVLSPTVPTVTCTHT